MSILNSHGADQRIKYTFAIVDGESAREIYRSINPIIRAHYNQRACCKCLVNLLYNRFYRAQDPIYQFKEQLRPEQKATFQAIVLTYVDEIPLSAINDIKNKIYKIGLHLDREGSCTVLPGFSLRLLNPIHDQDASKIFNASTLCRLELREQSPFATKVKNSNNINPTSKGRVNAGVEETKSAV